MSQQWWECKDHDWGNGPGSCQVYYSPDVNGRPETSPSSEGNVMRDNSICRLMPEGFVPPKD